MNSDLKYGIRVTVGLVALIVTGIVFHLASLALFGQDILDELFELFTLVVISLPVAVFLMIVVMKAQKIFGANDDGVFAGFFAVIAIAAFIVVPHFVWSANLSDLKSELHGTQKEGIEYNIIRARDERLRRYGFVSTGGWWRNDGVVTTGSVYIYCPFASEEKTRLKRVTPP